MRLVKLMWLAVCAVAAAGIAPAVTGRSALAAGDPAAKAEAIESFNKLNALPSFRMRWTTPEGTGLSEIVRPDKGHFVGKSAQGSIELFVIGTQHYTHYDFPGAPSGWRCSTGREHNTYFDIDKMRADTTTDVVRAPDTVIDGTPVHGYADAKTGDELYVGTQTGLPRRIVEREKTATVDFFDYGAPITITPPSCG
jgi:hypothetical protein